MDPARQDLVIDVPELGWTNREDFVGHFEEEDFRAFAGISLAVVTGLAAWTVISLILQFF